MFVFRPPLIIRIRWGVHLFVMWCHELGRGCYYNFYIGATIDGAFYWLVFLRYSKPYREINDKQKSFFVSPSMNIGHT